MNEQKQEGPSSEEFPAEKKRSGINWKLIDGLAKVFVAGLILLLCWNVLQSMFYEQPTRVTTQTRVNETQLPPPDPIGATQQLFEGFTQGSWSIGDGDWQLRVYPETEEKGLFTVPVSRRPKDPKFDDQKFLKMFNELGIKPDRKVGDFAIWSGNRPGFSFVMITCDSVIQVVRTRFLNETGYSIVEGIPRCAEADWRQSLLPIAEGIRQIATRTDARGQICSAILKIEPGYQGDLRSFWIDRGWRVRPLPVIVVSNGPSSERYSCSNSQGVVVEATFFLDNSTGQPKQVLLNRLTTLPD